MKIKNCECCGKEIEVKDLRTHYCDDCKKEMKQKQIDHANKLQSDRTKENAYDKAKEYIEKYITENKYTIPYEFNKVSPVTYRQIIQSCRGTNWVELLRKFNKEEMLKEYIKEQYLNYVNKTGKKSIKQFCENKNVHIPYQLVKNLEVRDFLKFCGRKPVRNLENDYKDNFFKIVEKYNRIPLYSEFLKDSKIMINNYAKHFGFKGKIYDQIVKMYVTDEEYNNYLKEKLEHKSKIGSLTGKKGRKLTDKELKENLVYIFDNFKKEYKKYPPRRIFNIISEHDDSTYRRRFKTSWTNICKMYGYDITDKCSAEYILLYKINKIMGYNCIRQKTWDWLIGIKKCNLFVDGYYEKDNLIIEADGRQHEEPVDDFGGIERFKIQKANDEIKNKLIPQHGMKLIRISFLDRDWFNEDHLKDILIQNGVNISNKLNNTENSEEAS